MSIIIALWTAFSLGLGSAEENSQTGGSLLLPVFIGGTVLVSNDGPAVLGSNITCYARLVDPDGHDVEDGDYKFKWEEAGKVLFDDSLNETTSNFTSSYKTGKHTVKISVSSRTSQMLPTINTTSFNVTETINGKLELSEGNATNLNKDTFETNKVLQIAASIYDPSGYFDDADIIYDWNVGNVYQTITQNQPTISYNFTLADSYRIDVNVSAFVPISKVYLKKLGYFSSVVYIKDKVSNVRISGSSIVTNGETHQYQITCNASLPAYLCSHLSSNSTCGVAVDGCDPVVMNDTCSAVIELHFNTSGTRCLSVIVANDVSHSALTTKIKVKQVIPHQKAISITVGILFGVIACLISICLVVQQVNKSRRRHVEVANFDFEEDDQNSTLRKFTKNVKNTCKMVSLKMSKKGKKETEYRPLISIEERNPHT